MLLDSGLMIYTVTLNPTLDRTLTVDRFCVGGTFKATHSDLLPAGKGINVARVVRTLAMPVVALGFVGRDDAPAFDAVLGQVGAENRLIPVPGATRSSVTILDPVQRTETHLREAGCTPPDRAVARLASELERVTAGDWVVLAGSLPPGMPVDTYARWIHLVHKRGARSILDTNGLALLAGVEAGPTVLKPNLFELWQIDRGRVHGMEEHDVGQVPMTDVLAAVRRLCARGVSTVVVSLGKRGVLGMDPSGQAWHVQTTLDRRVVDAVGSGDALAGGLVVGLAQGASFPDVLRLGVACGAANTLVAGAGRCERADVDRLLDRARARAWGAGDVWTAP